MCGVVHLIRVVSLHFLKRFLKMPPRKQPARLDKLCAETFARSLFKKFVEIESLKKRDKFEEANRLLDEAKSLCEKVLPTPVLETYIAPLFQSVFLKASGVGQIPAMESMFSFLCKAGMRILDLSWHNDPSRMSMRSMLMDLVPPMSNLRVAILRRSATSEVLELLTRNCEHLQELDISGACAIDFETLKMFRPDAAKVDKRFLDVHGCPKLASFRLLRCKFLGRPSPQDFASLLQGLKHLEELACEGLTGAFEVLLKEKRGREELVRRETSDHGSDILPNVGASELFDDEDRPYRLRELSITLQNGTPYDGAILDFVIESCPELRSFELTTQTEGHLCRLSRLKHLTKLEIIVTSISPRGPHVSCFTSRLTSLELLVDDLRSGVLVAVGESCENLVELRITLRGDSRELGVYPEVRKKAFRKLKTLHYGSVHPSASVDKNEWLYLTSGATNLGVVHLHGNANFMTDEFWVNFLTNVNPLKFLRRIWLVAQDTSRGFPMGKVALDAFFRSCPDLWNLSASFDPSLLPEEQMEEIRGEMVKNNFLLYLNKF